MRNNGVFNSGEIAEIVRGTLYGSSEVTFAGCVMDSRQIKGGELFAALPGEKTDGHLYIAKALGRAP